MSKNNIWNRIPEGRLLADVSLWSANLGSLADEVRRMDPHADLFHIDVADGRFVPALLFFPDLVAAIRGCSSKPFHVHLMVDYPDSLISEFVQAGADLVTLHLENAKHLDSGLDLIATAGAKAGIAVELETDVSAMAKYLDRVQIIVLMGTLLGIKGASLDERVLEKIARIKRLIFENGLTDQVKVSADGGIRVETVPKLRQAGADLITPGSLVFKSSDLEKTISWIRSQ
jgi:ribulose-phosphate 3-epimerase